MLTLFGDYGIFNKERSLRRVLHCDKTLRLVFSTFLSCSQMFVVFYHSVIHGLGFFICFKIQSFKTRFFYVLYSDKTWIFDQSERAFYLFYILMADIL